MQSIASNFNFHLMVKSLSEKVFKSEDFFLGKNTEASLKNCVHTCVHIVSAKALKYTLKNVNANKYISRFL